jgi:hypothetical protein
MFKITKLEGKIIDLVFFSMKSFKEFAKQTQLPSDLDDFFELNDLIPFLNV